MRAIKGSLPWFIAALVFALVAAYSVQVFLASNNQTVDVVVALRQVDPMSIITADAVMIHAVPAAAIPRGAAQSLDGVVGSYARYGLLPGQIVQTAAVMAADGGITGEFDARITQLARQADDMGLRATPLYLDEMAGYSLVNVGNRVDIFATIRTPTGAGEVLVAQDVLVMARLDSTHSGSTISLPGEPSEVPRATSGVLVLAADQETAARIHLASRIGDVSLSLLPVGGSLSEAPLFVDESMLIPSGLADSDDDGPETTEQIGR